MSNTTQRKNANAGIREAYYQATGKIAKTVKVAYDYFDVWYVVKNLYGLTGCSKHTTIRAAVSAAKKREGEGWVVVDSAGQRWWYNHTQGEYKC